MNLWQWLVDRYAHFKNKHMTELFIKKIVEVLFN